MNINEAKELWTKNLTDARNVAEVAEKANRDLTGEEMTQIKALVDAANEAKAVVESAGKSDSVKASIEALGNGITAASGETKTKSGLIAAKADETIGSAFVNSDEFQTMVKSLPTNPNQRTHMSIQSAPFQAKALVTGLDNASAGALILNDRKPIFERLSRKGLTMRSLVTNGSTNSDTVEYVKELTNVNNAAFVAEATSSAAPTVDVNGNAQTGVALTNNPGGGYKPEGGFTLGTASTTVKTLAEWMPVTNRALSDAGQIRTLIDSKLRDDLSDVEDYQLLSGNGAGENLTGMLDAGSGVPTYNTDITATTGEPVGMKYMEAIKRSKTKIRLSSAAGGGGAVATAVVMNPSDAEEIYFARLLKNPAVDGSADGIDRVAGLPIVESENMPAGKALIGDFSKAVIWDREGVTVSVTNSHADFFVRNLVAVLAEKRLAFGVVRPSAFRIIDLTAVVTPG